MDRDQTEILKLISSFLEKYKVHYMITGAWSTIFYGRPRASHDIDFIVELHKKDLARILEVFKKLPVDFSIQLETIEEAIDKQRMFNVLHLPSALKLDFWILTRDQFDRVRFKRRKKVKILGQFMQMSSAEDTIIQKLRWYEMGKIEKHIVDAAFVYQIQKKNLDKKYLDFWIRKLKLGKYFKKLEKIDLKKHL